MLYCQYYCITVYLTGSWSSLRVEYSSGDKSDTFRQAMSGDEMNMTLVSLSDILEMLDVSGWSKLNQGNSQNVYKDFLMESLSLFRHYLLNISRAF